MKILVDADACPVKHIIIKIAKEYDTKVIMLIDTSHIIDDGYSEVITVDQSRDAVDFALITKTLKDDIIVTQDYGVAAMGLSKGAKVINQNGIIYTDGNIEKLLFERHMSQKIRRSGGRTSGPKKRKKEQDLMFEKNFRKFFEVKD